MSFFAGLEKIVNKDVFIKITPEIPDCTIERTLDIGVFTDNFSVNITLPADSLGLRDSIGGLMYYLSPDNHPNLVLGWNIKSLFSFVLTRTGFPLKLSGKVLDLQVLERYIGVEKECPKSFEEAKVRLAWVVKHSNWNKLKEIYFSIYSPLVVSVIPKIESLGLIDKGIGAKGHKVHACYEIAGQVNGRMKCQKIHTYSYNPHGLTDEEKQRMRPVGMDEHFMYWDYKNMEVVVLQWLSGDPKLKELIDSGQDVYSGIWEALTSLKANDIYRRKCKLFFLPVVFGLGISSLAEKLGIPNDFAQKLVVKINEKFSVAMDWIQKQQDGLINGWATDIMGRKREFSDQQYRSRNFFIQSPASLFCCAKLVELDQKLSDSAKLVFHVHDGYVLSYKKSEEKKITTIVRGVLESEHPMFPGLRLKTSCKCGVLLP